MSRQDHKQEAVLSFNTIRSPDTHHALVKFCELFQACAGPCGKTHVVTNNSRGHLTVTGSCCRLLSSMSISRPELKLITSAVLAHLQRWGDGGGFMIHTICHLILQGSDLTVSPYILRGLYEMFLDIIVNHLSQPDCSVTIDISLSNLNVFLAYVHSVLSSKSLLNLTDIDCDKLSQSVLKAFLNSVPNEMMDSISKTDRVYCVTVENRPYSDSSVQSGLLLLYPECPVYNGCQEIQLRKHSLLKDVADKFGLPENETGIKVALFTCSLSGDFEEMIDAHFEVNKSEDEEVESLVMTEMLKLCDTLEELGVGILLCQKVIHPKVKVKLRSSCICFLDRLGAQVIPYLQDLTGAQTVATIMNHEDLKNCTGWVTSATHQVKFNRSYLLLEKANSSVVTFVLCGMWEEKLLEMKTCVKAAVNGLRTLVTEKKLLMGGGCWQVFASQVLKLKVLADLDKLSAQYSCHKAGLLEALRAFRASLLAWALALKADKYHLMMDPVSWHAWRVPQGKEDISDRHTMSCGCGLRTATLEDLANFQYVSVEEVISSSNLFQAEGTMLNSVEASSIHPHAVLDHFNTVVSGLKQAVSTANLVLSIGQFIIDKN